MTSKNHSVRKKCHRKTCSWGKYPDYLFLYNTGSFCMQVTSDYSLGLLDTLGFTRECIYNMELCRNITL